MFNAYHLQFELHPVNRTEAAEFYWLTDVYVKEIAAAYDIPAHDMCKVIGPAEIWGYTCSVCGQAPPVFTNRTHAQQSAKGYIQAEQHGASIGRCVTCQREYEARQEARTKAMFAEARKRKQERQERLKRLRAMPYREYLQTEHWQETRVRALRRAGYRCQTCNDGNTLLDVHHRTYENRGDERLSDLTVLCRGCHELFERNRSIA